MSVSFNKLFKLLIDRNMRKGELINSAGIGGSSLAKIRKGQNVNMDVLVKVCRALDCTFDDIMEIMPGEEVKTTTVEKCQSCAS